MLNTLKEKYSRFFSLHEVKNDTALIWYFGYIVFSFSNVFKGWIMRLDTARNIFHYDGPRCWPMFQNCEDLIFLKTLPDGYTQQYAFMAMMGIMVLSIFFATKKEWVYAHLCLFTLFLFKAYLTVISYSYSANYDYYQTTFAFIFLFLPHKRFFLMFTLVFFYFLSTATKIHESWILGTYFSPMATGIPIFPDSTIPIWTNLVIVMEMIFAWFLFSKYDKFRKLVFIFFVIFHLYSGILVGYHYQMLVLTPLVILFGLQYRPITAPIDWKSIPWCGLALTLLAIQMISHVIPGYEKMTLEGNSYGLYMFEANHQCIGRVYDVEEQKVLHTHKSASARNRCDPYGLMKAAQHRFCRFDNNKKYAVSFDHSINGGPFYRIVQETDLCALEYKPFSKNEWIRTPDKTYPTGRPTKNFYW